MPVPPACVRLAAFRQASRSPSAFISSLIPKRVDHPFNRGRRCERDARRRMQRTARPLESSRLRDGSRRCHGGPCSSPRPATRPPPLGWKRPSAPPSRTPPTRKISHFPRRTAAVSRDVTRDADPDSGYRIVAATRRESSAAPARSRRYGQVSRLCSTREENAPQPGPSTVLRDIRRVPGHRVRQQQIRIHRLLGRAWLGSMHGLDSPVGAHLLTLAGSCT